jgi:hypothetical protein
VRESSSPEALRAQFALSTRGAHNVVGNPECFAVPFCVHDVKRGGSPQHHYGHSAGGPARDHEEIRRTLTASDHHQAVVAGDPDGVRHARALHRIELWATLQR